MKKVILYLLFCPLSLFAQYITERTVEQSFEQSSIYFKSHYLNTYGLKNFKDIAAGTINDPFLNLYINPANLPKNLGGETLMYLDFRGDRTEPVILRNSIRPAYFNLSVYAPYQDPRWFTVTRSEPEPIVSVGILSYPFESLSKKIFIGGTFQIIHKEEKFYNVPYHIYYPLYATDPLGNLREGVAEAPSIDRYKGKDEMIIDAQLFSLWAGYSLLDNLTIGISLNGVAQSRGGEYLNENNDEYGNIKKYNWNSLYSQNRTQDYHHLDFSTGVSYNFTPKFVLGLKGGILKGNAEQNYDYKSSYSSKHNEPEISTEWYSNFSNSFTGQKWKHSGTTKYIGINFLNAGNKSKKLSGFYRYTISNVDLTNSSLINDTSFYSSRWINYYDTTIYNYRGNSSAFDKRQGSGTRRYDLNELLLNFSWSVTPRNKVSISVYYSSNETTTISNEPVFALRQSEYNNTSPKHNYSYSQRLLEDKKLTWEYKSIYRTFQIPLIFQFLLTENWELILGINKILNTWKINENTSAYFKIRERTDNGTVKKEENFIERYKLPDKKISEDFTKIFAGFKLNILNVFKAIILLDPDFEGAFRFAQWWLSFEARI